MGIAESSGCNVSIEMRDLPKARVNASLKNC